MADTIGYEASKGADGDYISKFPSKLQHLADFAGT